VSFGNHRLEREGMDGTSGYAEFAVCAFGLVHYCEQVIEVESVDRAKSYACRTPKTPVILDFEDACGVPGHGTGMVGSPSIIPPYPMITTGKKKPWQDFVIFI